MVKDCIYDVVPVQKKLYFFFRLIAYFSMNHIPRFKFRFSAKSKHIYLCIPRHWYCYKDASAAASLTYHWYIYVIFTNNAFSELWLCRMFLWGICVLLDILSKILLHIGTSKLERTEGTILKGQSRDTANTGHTRHMPKTKQKNTI